MKIKQAAISVLETLILVMLTSLIVGMSFVIYVNLNKAYLFAEATTADFLEVVKFKKVVEYDWHMSGKKKAYANDELILDQVVYSFEDQFIIRNSVVAADTFLLVPDEIKVHYISTQNAACDSLSLVFSKKTQKFRLDLHDHIDNKTLLELEY